MSLIDYYEAAQNHFWGYSRTFLINLLAYCFVIKVHCIFIFNRGVRIAHVRIQKMFVNVREMFSSQIK